MNYQGKTDHSKLAGDVPKLLTWVRFPSPAPVSFSVESAVSCWIPRSITLDELCRCGARRAWKRIAGCPSCRTRSLAQKAALKRAFKRCGTRCGAHGSGMTKVVYEEIVVRFVCSYKKTYTPSLWRVFPVPTWLPLQLLMLGVQNKPSNPESTHKPFSRT